MNSRTRRSYNRAKIALLVILLFGNTSLQAIAACMTNESPLRIVNIQVGSNDWIVVTWAPTCTNFIFGVLSTDDLLTTNTLWTGRGAMWGDPAGMMTWTDTTAHLSSRFFKVLRILPTGGSDWDADGLPDVWETDYGLNPFDPSDAHEDSDGDGADNLTEYLQGRDPTKGVTVDEEGIVNLLVFTPLE